MRKLIEAIKDRVQGKVPLLSKRSSHWPTIREHFLKSNPECAACGCKEKLQVHHIRPFHIYPSLELDMSNLITLCEAERECHLRIGHNSSWRNENENVRADAQALRKSLTNKILNN